jgi:biotin carboxylase
MKKLLLLGGSRYLLPVIREAKALGCHVITCDYLPGNIAHRYSDEYRNVSIVEKDAVLALARELGIDGIMSFACDPGVVTAAYVAEALGLPSVGPYESVALLQDKGRFRSFLRDKGFRVPAARSFDTPEEALREIRHFPVMVKPVDSAGSKGVSRADHPEELPGAIANALAFSRCGRILAEDYIQAAGFPSDSECFSVDGELRFASFNNQYFDKRADNPYTPAGFTWPSGMSDEHQKELRDELQRLLRLLHMGTAVYNVESRVGTDGQAYLMEVSPRGGGNRLCEMLQYTTGTNLIRNAVKAALGLPPEELHGPDYKGYWSYVALHSYRSGRFAGLRISEEARKSLVEEDLWVRPGETVEAFSGANKTIGTLVLNWPDAASRDAHMADMESWLEILVEDEADGT